MPYAVHRHDVVTSGFIGSGTRWSCGGSEPPPPFSRGSARLVRRHRPLTSVFALGLRSEIEFLGRFFSGVDQLLPTLPMQGGHGGEGRHAGGSRQTVGLDGGLRMRAQGMRRRCLLSAHAAMFAM